MTEGTGTVWVTAPMTGEELKAWEAAIMKHQQQRRAVRLFVAVLCAIALTVAAAILGQAHATDWRPGYIRNTGCTGQGVASGDFFAGQSDGNGECVTLEIANSPTYFYAGQLTTYATPTDLFCLKNTTSGKRVRVVAFAIDDNATAATFMTRYWMKRPTADTGGTSTSPTPGQSDSGDAAPGSTLINFTAAPSLTAGQLFGLGIGLTGANGTSTVLSSMYAVDPLPGVDGFHKPMVLNANEEMCLDYAGAALPSGYAVTVFIEWTEYAQ